MKRGIFFLLLNIIIIQFVYSLEVKMFSKDSSISFVSGYLKEIKGNSIEYKTFYPDAHSALLVRCINNDYIEWQSGEIVNPTKYITFVWIVSYATGTSDGLHNFTLFINNKGTFNFSLGKNDKDEDWKLLKDGCELSFKFIKRDNHDDHTGYMFLKIPREYLEGSNSLIFKVIGDSSNSRAGWFMVFKKFLETDVSITPEYAILKSDNNQKKQRIRILTHYFDNDGEMKISVIGQEDIITKLKFGLNEYILPLEYKESNPERTIDVFVNDKKFSKKVKLNKVKHFEVYIIPHSHVDIGYTASQIEVEKTQIKNIEKAIDLIDKTKNYPLGSRFKWNPEVLWPVKCFLEKAANELKEKFIKYVKDGYIGLDGLFANELTGLCTPEELIRSFDYSNVLEKEIGVKIESAMISDIPGYSWGIVTSAAQNGIRYFSSGPNNFDRIGYTLSEWGDKPFYWLSKSGTDKLLVWVAGKGYAWFHGWKLSDGDPTLLLKYLEELGNSNYPYDIVQLRYTIGGDNGYPDPKLADFVKNWNEKYESPKLKIATCLEMFNDFENKYQNIIPSFTGDFTPYWENGAGSTALETAINRASSEKLNQLENLYTIFSNDFPFSKFDSAWENVILFTEHTWGAFNSVSEPESEFVKNQWRLKKNYCEKAQILSDELYLNLFPVNNSNKITEFAVYNSLSWYRTDIVKIPKEWVVTGNIIKDESGNIMPTQKLSNGELVFVAKNIPPFSFKKFYFANEKANFLNDITFKNNSFSNKYFKILFDEKTGSISSIVRLSDNYEFVDKNSEYLFNQYIYTGHNASNRQVSENPKIEVKEIGNVFTSIIIKSNAPGCNKLEQEIVLYNDIDRIDIFNIIDKKNVYEKENVRFAFPINIKEHNIKMDVAWSVVTPEKDQLPGANKNYFTVNRWIDVSNKENGLTIAAINVPFFEFGEMTAESYMDSPNSSGIEQKWRWEAISSPLLFSWVMNNSWHTNYKASQEGVFIARYSIKPHDKFDYLSSYKFGIENSQPLFVSSSIIENKLGKSIPKIDEKLVITSIRPTRDNKNLLIRLFNPTDQIINFNIKKEQNKYYLSLADGSTIKKLSDVFYVKPFEVLTLKISK